MEAKEVSVREVRLDSGVDVTVVYSLEKMSDGLVGCTVVSGGNADEDVKGVHAEACGFTTTLFDDGLDDVSWKWDWLWRWCWGIGRS